MADNDNGMTGVATFAGGCFWCMVHPFEKLEGVTQVTAGYIGGSIVNPTYKEVCSQRTGHYEAVQVRYKPEAVKYEELLEVFWKQIDPTDAGGQFHDRGPSYKTAIFFHDEEQRIKAEASKKALGESGKFDRPIATAILPAAEFYPAEEYHQQYHEKNPTHYQLYRVGSGRDRFIREKWGEGR